MNGNEVLPVGKAVPQTRPTPTTEQLAIIEAPQKAKILVNARPGTGKTFTLIRRLQHLVLRQRVPGVFVLVLSFSRAAVGEIRRRLDEVVQAGVREDIRTVNIRTFDSFASALLYDLDYDLDGLDYDERIRLFTEKLAGDEPDRSVTRRVRRIRHLLVDEVQDLVGYRAQMVQAILDTVDCGFTLLGDPNQAIYGFVAEEEGGPTALEFLDNIRELHQTLDERTLTRNYRHSPELAKLENRLVKVLARGDEGTLNEVLEIVEETREYSRGRIGDGLPPGENGCILCRTNGEVLDVVGVLARNEIPFRYQAGSDEFALPAWIARVLGGTTEGRVRRNSFVNRFEELVGEDASLDAEDAWQVLKAVEGGDGKALERGSLLRALKNRARFPDELSAFEEVDRGITVSTIHKSKGREFDHVRLLTGFSHLDADMDEEARLVYVASTRARRILDRLKRSRAPINQLPSTDNAVETGRWARIHGHEISRIEVGRPDDLDVFGPVNTYICANRKGVDDLQDYLWNCVEVGDPVLIQWTKKGRTVFYEVRHLHNNRWRVLGQMSRSFKRALRTFLPRYPYQLTWVYVVAKTTEVVPGYPEGPYERSYLESGLWMNIRLKALAGVRMTKGDRNNV